MKIRNGFVSNSSSSSFIIDKYYLSPHQIVRIHDHKPYAGADFWAIGETPNTISGETSMDNFDMCGYLRNIGILDKYISWGN